MTDTQPKFTKLAELKIDSLALEIAANQRLIDITSGGGDAEEDEGGSDSEPSEDNLEDWELEKITTIPSKEAPKKEEPAKVKKTELPKRT